MGNRLYTVVAVDDEIWALRGLCNIVDWESFGFTIVGSYIDSNEAIKNIISERPDVIFTDIRMPGIDGMELIEAIHNSGVDSRLVIVSAYRDFDVAKKAISKDVTDYLMKPLDKKEVADLLSRLKLTLDRANSDTSFDIKHFDLSQKGNLNNSDVKRYLDRLSDSNICRLIVSNRELLETELIGSSLTEIYVNGYQHSYLSKEIPNSAVFLKLLNENHGLHIGVSRIYSSFSDISKMLEDVKESFEGSFLYSDNPKISEIQDYLSKNYTIKLSLPEIAEHFFVSESYLYELFRKNTDTSVVGFIKNIRLCKAAAMLSLGSKTVSEISNAVGYTDVGYFGKLFKAKYGCTPEQYTTVNTTSLQ